MPETMNQKRVRFLAQQTSARNAPLDAICRACGRTRRDHPDGRGRHWFVPPLASPAPPRAHTETPE
jgi:hypothetical protein